MLKFFYVWHLIFFSAMACLGLGLVVLTRSIMSYQRTRLRFRKIFIVALSLLLYHLVPSIIFGYLNYNDKIVLTSSFWRGFRVAYSLQTPIMLSLIAFFLIRLFLLMQGESWRRLWLYLLMGIQVVPIVFRFLDAASVFPFSDPVRSRLYNWAFIIFFLACYGGLIAVSGRAQARNFPGLSPIQARYLKWAGRTGVFLFGITLAIELINTFARLSSEASGALSVVPVFLLLMISLLFMDRLIAVMYPHEDPGRPPEERFQSLVKEYGITNREIEIIRLICLGKTNKEIEEGLFISMPTVKDHISNIFRKTGVANRVQLAALFHFESGR
jgi:DNA-binding CsgD family transcriptional regulator